MNRNRCIKCWCGMMTSSNLDDLSSIHSHPFSIFNSKWFTPYLKSPWSNLNSPSSTLLPHSSVKRTWYLTQKVLKTAWFPTKCPQAPLAQLATFSRSVCVCLSGWDISRGPGSQAPTKSSDSHKILSAFHTVLAQIWLQAGLPVEILAWGGICPPP